MKSRIVIALFIGLISVEQASAMSLKSTSVESYCSDEMDDVMEEAITRGANLSKRKAVQEDDKSEAELVQEACDEKLDSSVYTSSDSWLPSWDSTYVQATTGGRRNRRAIDLPYRSAGSKTLLTGTSSETIDGLLDKQDGDETFGVKENVTIDKYKGTDEIKDLSSTDWGNGPSSKSADSDCGDNCDTSPQEDLAWKAAYKTAYAAARGGASTRQAKEAAYSAVYGTGQGNQKKYEYNSPCVDCQGTLDGAEYETGDQGIQVRGGVKKQNRVQTHATGVCDDTYLEQADDILSETLDKDLVTYQKKQARQKQDAIDDEQEQELVFDQAIDQIPKARRPPTNAAVELSQEEDKQLVDLFSDQSNLVQLDQQITVDESEKSKSFAYSKAELEENKSCESVYTDVTDE